MAERVNSGESSWVEAIIGLLALAGLADSILLTIEYYKAVNSPCVLPQGCSTVITSQWTSIGFIPAVVVGIIFFGLLLFAAIYSVSNKTALSRRLLLGWSSLGLIGIAWLIFVQTFIVRVWCQYCLLASLAAALIFACALIAYGADRNKSDVLIEKEVEDDEAEA